MAYNLLASPTHLALMPGSPLGQHIVYLCVMLSSYFLILSRHLQFIVYVPLTDPIRTLYERRKQMDCEE
jgi:hypothetical protein